MIPALAQPLVWQTGGTEEMIYRCRHADQTWEIALGDFPAEPLYTLWIDGQKAAELDDWPAAWVRPQ